MNQVDEDEEVVEIEPEVTKVKPGSIAHKGLIALLEVMQETETKDAVYVLPGSNIAIAVAIVGVAKEHTIH